MEVEIQNRPRKKLGKAGGSLSGQSEREDIVNEEEILELDKEPG